MTSALMDCEDLGELRHEILQARINPRSSIRP